MIKLLTTYGKWVGLVLLIALLAACGADKAAEGNAKQNAEPANAANEETAAEKEPVQAEQPEEQTEQGQESSGATRTIETPNGPLEIPAEPLRIVTDGYLPELLVLGLQPVGSTKWDLENKAIADRIAGIENTGERSLEKMLDLEPDLIITWINPANDAKIIEQYEKLAPTMAVPYGHYSSDELITYLGEALGREAEAATWLTEFEQEAQEARAVLAEVIEPDATFALMGVFVVDKAIYIYGDGGYRGGEALYRHLQLTPPAKQQAEMIGQETYRQISAELVGDYAGDYIFLDQGQLLDELWDGNDGVWKSLDAVKNDRVFQLDPDLFWGNDPISVRLQVQALVDMITEREQQ